MDTLTHILGEMKRRGRRMTKARKAILTSLAEAKNPMAAADVHGKLARKGVNADKVTVYRELSSLVEAGIASRVTLTDGIQRYELMDEHGHKHHLICTRCDGIENVEMNHDDLASIEKDISKKKKFRVQSHSLEFYGLCSRCG